MKNKHFILYKEKIYVRKLIKLERCFSECETENYAKTVAIKDSKTEKRNSKHTLHCLVYVI